MFRKFLNRGPVSVALSVLLSVFFVTAVVNAATTITTSIATGGALSVTGLSTLGQASSTMLSANTAYFGQSGTSTFSSTGALAVVGGLTGTTASFTSTLGVTGLSTLGQASSTMLSAGSAYFGTTATSSFSTAGVLSLQNGETISNATDGTITLTAATTTLSGDLLISPNGRIYVHPTLSDRETGSYINQAIKADVTLASAFGASDSSDEWFGAAIRSRLMGSNLTGANNTVGALEGSYQITGTNASTYPKGAVLGEIGGNSTTADGAFVAYTDGDVGTLNSAGAAFKVMNNNNAVSGSKFNYGLDIFDAGHAGLAAVTIGIADIRLVKGDTISNTAASSTVLSSDLTIGSGTTIGSGDLVIKNNGNAAGTIATSTLSVGCVQVTATSSATKIKMVFNAVSTTTDAGHDAGTGTAAGYVLWAYGTCP